MVSTTDATFPLCIATYRETVENVGMGLSVHQWPAYVFDSTLSGKN